MSSSFAVVDDNNDGDEDDITSNTSGDPAADLRICTDNINRISELGIVGGQEVDESDYDSRFLSTSSETATNTTGTTTTTTTVSQHASLIHNEHSDEYEEEEEDPHNTEYHHRDSPTVGGGGRIQFSTQKLYGRDKQLKLLHKYFNDEWKTLSSPSSHLKVVHVTGYSGSGKTRLVNEFIQQLKQQQQQQQQESSPTTTSPQPPLYIMHGKYEEPTAGSSTPVPYKGISEALNGWYSSLTEKEKVSLSSYMQKHFLKIVGDDLSVLIDIVPCLKRLLVPAGRRGGKDHNNNGYCDSTSAESSPTTSYATTNADDPINKTRLHFVFQSFLKCLCESGATVVEGEGEEGENKSELSSLGSILFYFDNMHWADVYTLDMLRSILADITSKCNSMVILTTRSNEIEGQDDHPLNKRLLNPIQKVRRKELEDDGEGRTGIHTMKVTNLTQSDIGEFIADTLLLKGKDVEPLSEAIYKRTLGNIFFTMQAMEQLYRQNFLYYDLVSFQWQWVQLSKEQFEDHLSEDIVEMVRSKIKCLSNDAQRTISVFSHTRSTLDVDTLLELVNATSAAAQQINSSSSNEKLNKNNNASYDKSGLLQLVNEAVEEGLLTTSARMIANKSFHSNSPIILEYSFVHDRIREAARSFWVGDILHENLFFIGNALVLRGSDYHVGEDWMLITAVQHLNSIPPRFHDGQGKLSLARLNLETAKLSMGIAALEDAANYAENGIQYLPQNRWDAHGVISHELYALAAESSRLTGHLTQMERYCTTCLTAEKEKPQATKCDIYFTFASGLFYGSQRFKEAKEIVLDVLRNLGCPFPRSAIGAQAKTLSRLIRLVMTKRKRTVNDVEKMDFMTDEIAIKTMKFLDLLFSICYCLNDELLTPLIMFKALEYTLNYGVSVFSPRLIASISVIFTGPLNSLRDGERHSLYSLELMKKVNHGPIESGTLMVVYIFGLHWSTPTIDCVPPLREAYKVGMNTGQVENACWCMSLIQLLLFQSGTSLPALDAEMRACIPKMEEMGQKTIALASSGIWKAVLGLMGAPDLIDFTLTESAKSPALKATFDAYKKVMLAYLGEYEHCADIAVTDGNRVIKVLPGSPTVPFEMFLTALSCFEMARQNPGKPAYLKTAKRTRKWIVSWAKQGSPNIQHRRTLLDAEFAAIQRQDKLALERFELAVDLALKGKFTNDAAVANERWGTFAFEVLGNEAEGRRRMNDAVVLSTKWGAVEKIQRLKARFPTIFQRQQLAS